MNHHHTQLLKKQLRHNQTTNPRKKRKRHAVEAPETIIVHENSSDSSEDLEDVDLGADIEDFTKNDTSDAKDGSNHDTEGGGDGNDAVDDEDDDFDHLEDVDLDQIFDKRPSDESETLTFNIGHKDEEPAKKTTRRFVPVPKEERQRRKLIHKLYLETMMAHGVVRNQWCNDKELQTELRKKLPADIFEFLRLTNLDVLDYVKSRRFIEAIRKAAGYFHRKFRVTSQGLVRKDWETMLQRQSGTDGKITLNRFRRLVKNFRGSRDIAAQGFVALLRSLGVTARLVFSLQPPDWRSIVPVGANKEEERKETMTKSKNSEFEPVFIPNSKQGFLMNARSAKEKKASKKEKYSFPTSSYPIFWAEVWNKFSKKWITVDPIVHNVVEVMPMRRKCKFEPPATDPTNQTWYVIAYDNKRNVKDVTRRYTQYYNAKTVKKRIELASDEDEHWYLQLLRGARPPRTTPTEAEILETKEFYDRDICEGVPNNMTDFKNHPVYALESQLRQDEVIHPKDETSKCGTFKPMNKNTTMAVYKRSHVFRLRTAKAWYMRGRILKVGVQPLKTKTVNRISFDDEGDDDGIERLYAEFQTEMYRAPPIVDGKITKNAYGNLEIYTPTMMPDNGYLVKMTDEVTMKLLERAARDILRIDYAKAIVAFDFGGAKKNRTPTAREGGIVIDQQYEEAMLLVVEQLQDMAEEEKRRQVELNALRSWKFFIKKLEIMNRLDRQHGKLDDQRELREEEEEIERGDGEDEEGYFSVASEDENSGGDEKYVPRKRRKFMEEDDFEEGGFMLGEGGFSNPNTEGGFDDSHSGNEEGFVDEGGFVADEGGFVADEGGFVADEGADEEGGFLAEEEERRSEEGGEFTSGQEKVPNEGGFFPEEELPDDAEGGFLQEDLSFQDPCLQDAFPEDGGFLPEDGGFLPEDGGFLPQSPKSEPERPIASGHTPDALEQFENNSSDSDFDGETELPESLTIDSEPHILHRVTKSPTRQFSDKASSSYNSSFSEQSATPESAPESSDVYRAEESEPELPKPRDNVKLPKEGSGVGIPSKSDKNAGKESESPASPGFHNTNRFVNPNRKDIPVVDVESDDQGNNHANTEIAQPSTISQPTEIGQFAHQVFDVSSEEDSVVEISDMSEIEKEEEELGLVYSDSDG